MEPINSHLKVGAEDEEEEDEDVFFFFEFDFETFFFTTALRFGIVLIVTWQKS